MLDSAALGSGDEVTQARLDLIRIMADDIKKAHLIYADQDPMD